MNSIYETLALLFIFFLSWNHLLWEQSGTWSHLALGFENRQSNFYDLFKHGVVGEKFQAHSPLLKPKPQRDEWELISSTSDVVPTRDQLVANLSPSRINVMTRLRKLDYCFNSLKIYHEDCRHRFLCEMAENPAKFSPLSEAFLDETSYNEEEGIVAAQLGGSNEGTKLMSYIKAAENGRQRRDCRLWTYRCPQATMSMIDYKSLLIWREVSKWLTVKMVAKRLPSVKSNG